MKKQMFRVLCVVLALALLAPNVFAATQPPEVPLADEATVTRVKNEIAQGQITDVKDVFLVAYQHLGADLEEEGMTAYINEDGTLGFTQVISAENKMTRSGEAEDFTIATSSMLLVDNDGNQITTYDVVSNAIYDSGYGGLDSVSVYAVHTAYFNVNSSPDIESEFGIQLSYMVTNITYGSSAYRASQLVQSYQIIKNLNALAITGSKTVPSPAAGTDYEYHPSGMDWYDPLQGADTYYGHILTTATIYIANTSLSFQVNAVEGFWGSEYYDSTLADYLKPTP